MKKEDIFLRCLHAIGLCLAFVPPTIFILVWIFSATKPGFAAFGIVEGLSLLGIVLLGMRLYFKWVSKQPPLTRCPTCGQILPNNTKQEERYADTRP